MEKCENCERVIRGDVYWTADDYPLCEECWGRFADLNLAKRAVREGKVNNGK